jgi:integrase
VYLVWPDRRWLRAGVHKRDQRVLDHDQISQLLANCQARYRPLLATALFTGLRLNELLGLVWGEIDLHDGFVHVRYQLSRPHPRQPAQRVRLKTPAGSRDITLVPQLGAVFGSSTIRTAFRRSF